MVVFCISLFFSYFFLDFVFACFYYYEKSKYFAELEAEAVNLCRDGLPELVFGRLWK